MNATKTGLLAGLLLGTAAAAGGFVGFLIALVLGAAGLVIGRVLDGDMEFSDLVGRGRDR